MSIVRYPTAKPFPFSDAVKANGFIFLSGQVSMTPEGNPLYGSVNTQTEWIMHAISTTLSQCGATLDDIVRAKVWLSDIAYLGEFNQAYQAWFPKGFPARSVTTSPLAYGLDVEIEVMALDPEQTSHER